MYRITYTAGIGQDANGAAITQATLAPKLAFIRASLASVHGGYTETEAVGGWVSPAGELVTEPARRWVVLSDSRELANKGAELIRRTLNQSAVVLEVEQVEAHFIGAEAEVEAIAA